MPSNDNYLKPGGDTRIRSEVKTSSRQQQFFDVGNKTRNGKKGNENDELVKSFVNLSEYLQTMDKGEHSQDKALNLKGNASVSSSSRQRTQPSFHSSRSSSRKTYDVKLEKDTRREIDQIIMSGKQTLSSGIRRKEVQDSRKKRNPIEPKSLVLILPKHSSKINAADVVHTSKPTLTFDGTSKEANDETSLAVGSSSGVLNVVSCSKKIPTVSSQAKYVESFTTTSKALKEKDFDETDELGAVKGPIASPSRRFSLGFGKISRSFSSKENTGPIRSEPSHRFSSNEVHSSSDLYPFSLLSFPLPTGKETHEKPSTRRHSIASTSIASKKQLSEDVTGPIELDAVQNKHSSPNRRFGFTLGKIKRSFSSKEDLNIPQSSPMRAVVPDHSAFPKENKDILHSNFRSSPLRRLFDPIFKTKVTYPCPSAETSKSLEPYSKFLLGSETFDNKKSKESPMVQALLQMTTKNELPLFKLVVNNSCDILVAMKNATPTGKQDIDSIYTFYAVREIKKKRGSWIINQAHKEKAYGFGYNVVGQMKGFVPFCNDSSVDKLEDRFTEKEFVLCSVECKKGDGEKSELVSIRELASTIVKIPHGKLNDDADDRNIGKELTGKVFSEYLEEEKYLFGRGGERETVYDTTVILPGGDHGLPNNGAPSSLIQRWRSGGSCDCGGWDVGCKLQILTNEGRSCKLFEPSLSCSIREHFDLFNQEESHNRKPIFSLAPFKKGIYSVAFSSSISLLQALSICIAATSSRQSFDFSELTSDEKLFKDSNLTSGSIYANYRPSPPSLPIRRV